MLLACACKLSPLFLPPFHPHTHMYNFHSFSLPSSLVLPQYSPSWCFSFHSSPPSSINTPPVHIGGKAPLNSSRKKKMIAPRQEREKPVCEQKELDQFHSVSALFQIHLLYKWSNLKIYDGIVRILESN